MSSLNFKKTLVPIDFSETALRAVEHATLLAKKNNAEITFIHVEEPKSMNFAHTASNFNMPVDTDFVHRQKIADAEERVEEEMTEALKGLENKIKRQKIAVADSIIETGKISKKIAATAKKIQADIIVMGTHGASGMREFMVGSNTYKVISESHIPVLSIREEFIVPGFKNILLPFIDAPHMREHVDYAIKLAKIYGATLNILGIDNERNPDHFRKVRREAEQIKGFADKANVKSTIDVFPSSYMNEFIMGYGEKKKVDLIVIMADINKVGVMQYLTGPVVQQIVNHSPIPVLSIPMHFNPKLSPYA